MKILSDLAPVFARNPRSLRLKGRRGNLGRGATTKRLLRLPTASGWLAKTMEMDKHGYVYIMTNSVNTVLYTGVTSDLKRRVWEHKEKLVDGFTKRYNVTKLVYYESSEDMLSAIAREKQIKGGSRLRKIRLVEGMNKEWCDLYDDL